MIYIFPPISDCKGGFKCSESGECIPLRWKCDLEQDCEDGSDEYGCREFTSFLYIHVFLEADVYVNC